VVCVCVDLFLWIGTFQIFRVDKFAKMIIKSIYKVNFDDFFIFFLKIIVDLFVGMAWFEYFRKN